MALPRGLQSPRSYKALLRRFASEVSRLFPLDMANRSASSAADRRLASAHARSPFQDRAVDAGIQRRDTLLEAAPPAEAHAEFGRAVRHRPRGWYTVRWGTQSCGSTREAGRPIEGLGFRESRARLAAMKKPRDVIQPRWGVFALRKKAERLPVSVQARDSEEAIELAIKENNIPERDRWRISVRREA